MANLDVAASPYKGYQACGCGMGPALNIAASSSAYVLADRGTWLNFKNRADLGIVVEGDSRLFNQYGVMVVNPAKHPHVKVALAQAFADWARRHGWRFVMPHFRGCSGELNRAPRAYHSGDFEEIGWMLAQAKQRHAGPMVAVGVSLGGNALLRWAEEAGDTASATARAVAAISSPIDLAAGGHAIGRGFNRLVYTRMFLRSMKPKALAKLAQHPGLFSREKMLAARDLYEFDDVFTAPLHGFAGTDDYWRRGSAKPHLPLIRIPALVLNALNDPFVPGDSLPRPHEVGRHVTLWQPAHGGHVGFPGGRWPGHVMTLPEQVMGWLARHL